MPKKIAVILSGCGYLDGAEITESVMALYAIQKHGAEPVCFAPDIPQRHVVDHLTGAEAPEERRNVLVESARIARGAVRDVAEFDAAAIDALVLPGGFGAAKNLSSFAVDGPDFTIDPGVEAAIRATVAAGKPIGALCIAPAIMAKIFAAPTLTIGQDAATAAALESLGAVHQPTGAGEIVVDRANRLVTTPCYMLPATIPEIAQGAENAVAAVLEMI